MTSVDIVFVIFVAIFILCFYRVSFWILLKSFISFLFALVLSSILLNPFLSTLIYFGWTESIYTPLFSFPFLIVVIWGILLSLLMVLFPRNFSPVPRYASVIVLAFFGPMVYLLLLMILIRFFPTDLFRQEINDSFIYRQVNKINLATNFKNKYLNEILKPVLVSKQDTRAFNLNFEIINPKVLTAPADELFAMVNSDRAKKGAQPLKRDPELDKLAQSYAFEIISTKYFSHYSKNGLSPEQRGYAARVKFNYLGENLALAPDSQTAFNSLMSSPGHRENIELPIFARTGISCVDLGNGEKLFVEEFAN